MNEQIRVIVFDLDETLMYEAATERRAYVQVCNTILANREIRSRKSIDKTVIDAESMCDRLFEIAESVWSTNPVYEFTSNICTSPWEGLWGKYEGSCTEYAVLASWVPGYRVRCWRGMLTDAGIEATDDEVSRIIEASIQARNSHHVVFDDTRGYLDRFKLQFTLALLTNGASSVQRAKIYGAGLEHYFSAIVVSGDLCEGKPHPSTYRRICELVQASPEACLMVGDSYEKDVTGARQAGMNALLIDRTETVQIPHETVLRNLSDLYAYLS